MPRSSAASATRFGSRPARERRLFLVMVTTRGVRQNAWYEELIDDEVTLDDLFR